jgi:glycine/D-amino acid oxidase-like deaminating enzyme
MNTARRSDILIVGAGIAGLSHAIAAVERGLAVTVIDRDARAVGASVRNFGHACVTAQSGELLALALAAREKWLRYGRLAGFFVTEFGALATSDPRRICGARATRGLASERAGASADGPRGARAGGRGIRSDDPRGSAASSVISFQHDVADALQPGDAVKLRVKGKRVLAAPRAAQAAERGGTAT